MGFCVLLIFLLTSTVLSLRIETMMKNSVKTVTAIEGEGADENKLPLACYQWDETFFSFFYVDEREGLFGKELFAVKKEQPPFYTDEEYAIISSSAARDENNRPLRVICEAAWPVEDGEPVVLDGVSVKEVDVVRQIWILTCLAAILLPGVLLLARSVKKFGSLQEGNVKDGIEGAVIVLIWLIAVFVLMGQLQIPREYLPPKYILDIPFYIRKLDELNFVMAYKREILIAGGCILGVWIGAVSWKIKRHGKKEPGI